MTEDFDKPLIFENHLYATLAHKDNYHKQKIVLPNIRFIIKFGTKGKKIKNYIVIIFNLIGLSGFIFAISTISINKSQHIYIYLTVLNHDPLFVNTECIFG